MRLHKGRKTGDGKQETENTDGKQEARSAESQFEIAQRAGNRRRKTGYEKLETETHRRKTGGAKRRRNFSDFAQTENKLGFFRS